MASNTSDNLTATPPAIPRGSSSGRHLRLFAFYVGVPVVVAMYGAFNNWELLASAGYDGALFFYAAHGTIPWWMTCASTSLAMWSLRSIKPPPYILMGIGALFGGLIALPYSNWLTDLYGTRWQDPQLAQQVAPLFSPEFWRFLTQATILWFIVNFVFDRFLGLPRYRYVIPRGYDYHDRPVSNDERTTNDTGTQPERPLPAFAERIPAILGPDDILAIKAEQHYIRVFTPQQEFMVLYRFSDAVRELDPALGLQVHRSYWVNKAAVTRILPSAKKFMVQLSTGEKIPVSTPYHGMVKEFARANQVPIR